MAQETWPFINAECQKLLTKNMVTGIKDRLTSDLAFCESCVKSKQTRLPFDRTRFRAKRPLQLVHSDICGPINVDTHDGKKYFCTFVDDFTHNTVTFLMSAKSELFDCFSTYKAMAESHFGLNLSRLRCDNGGEYTSTKLKDKCKRDGVKLEFTTPYSPELNGVAERMNRTLAERAKSMLVAGELPKMFWGDAIFAATYLINRSPTNSLNSKTPYELWFGRKPDLSNLKVFGCQAYAFVPKEKRVKFDDKSQLCIMLGYSDCGYRLWNPDTRSILISRDVKFNESTVGFKNAEKISVDVVDHTYTNDSCDGDCADVNPSLNCPARTPQKVIDAAESDNEFKTPDVMLRPQRERKLPSKYNDYILDDDPEAHIAMNVANWIEDVPVMYEDIVNHPKEAEWRSAVNEEIKSLEKNKTWTVVPKINGVKLIGTKWVFKTKFDDEQQSYKARLVAKGFMQKAGVDFSDTYAPVARLPTIRILLADCLTKGLGRGLFQKFISRLGLKQEEVLNQ